jgi:xylan 1,4-beta-xylosidase
MARTPFFNAHHSPIGAFATLTLGAKGATGGFGLELDKPACANLYIGAETSTPGQYKALPFFGEGRGPQADDFDVEAIKNQKQPFLSAYDDAAISRTLTPCFDEWKAEDLTFRVITPIRPIPDPQSRESEQLAQVIIPCVWIELTLDNSQGSSSRKIFFGQGGGDPYAGLRHAVSEDLTGVWLGRNIGFFTKNSDAYSGIGFGPQQILAPNDPTDNTCMLGQCGLVVLDVPAGETKTLRLVGAFYRDGLATTGIDTSYLYTYFFSGLESVASFGLLEFDEAIENAKEADESFAKPELNESQRFMLAHSLRSYYGSTQLLKQLGGFIWNVNEGEYRMMNTFDLTADHLFYELKMNPWVQKNALDLFVERYSYYDEIGGEKALAFTHDMGVGNHFSRPGWSSYERRNEPGCFSHMSHEELVNWVLCACMTLEKTKDWQWQDSLQSVFSDCLKSLCLRDNPDPSKRTGIMSIDSPRCGPNGAEITTYDSLDPSLGQSRASTYLGFKTLASYAHLAKVVASETERLEAENQAKLALRTLLDAFQPDGTLPALLENDDRSLIIPVFEGLIFFKRSSLWDEWIQVPEFAELVHRFKGHLQAVLAPGKCLFPNGGWKLSASSANSWLSKIYLCQHIARTCLDYDGLNAFEEADSAHVDWLLHPESAFWAWSDQMVDGVAKGSKYYPRGVTSVLWLDE